MKLSVRLLPPAAAVLLLVLGAVGYVLFIPTHTVHRSRLATLVAHQPPGGFKAKPTTVQEVPSAKSQFSDVAAAGKQSPNSTGAYQVSWQGNGKSSSSDQASVLVSMLPSTKQADAVLAQAEKLYLSSKGLKSDGYAKPQSFSVPSVPGAHAATLTSTSKSSAHLAVSVMQAGRYVVVSLAQESGSPGPEPATVELTQAEANHLRALGQGFSLKPTRYPPVASLVYGALTVLLAALVVLVPLTFASVRRRRRQEEERMRSRQVLIRGSKIARRQGVRR